MNDNGTLLSAFGKYLPPTENRDFAIPSRLTDTFDTGSVPNNTLTSAQSIALNPGSLYSNQNFLKFLRAQIVSAYTKILAIPTIILNELPGRSGGVTVAFSDISAALSSGSIGRTFGNEGFVIVGNDKSNLRNIKELKYRGPTKKFAAQLIEEIENNY